MIGIIRGQWLILMLNRVEIVYCLCIWELFGNIKWINERRRAPLQAVVECILSCFDDTMLNI
jgi:hypothetical protein